MQSSIDDTQRLEITLSDCSSRAKNVISSIAIESGIGSGSSHSSQSFLTMGRTIVSLTISCPACSQKLTANEKLFGKRVKCPKCAAAIQIPSPQPSNDLSDLLDEEMAMAPSADEVSSPSPARGPRCERCGDELVEGSRYCVACGHNNMDVAGAIGQTELELGARQQKMEAQSRPRHWLWRALIFWG
jgi:hypothetical protein